MLVAARASSSRDIARHRVVLGVLAVVTGVFALLETIAEASPARSVDGTAFEGDFSRVCLAVPSARERSVARSRCTITVSRTRRGGGLRGIFGRRRARAENRSTQLRLEEIFRVRRRDRTVEDGDRGWVVRVDGDDDGIGLGIRFAVGEMNLTKVSGRRGRESLGRRWRWRVRNAYKSMVST